MLCACIDIGSNTTRVLVADVGAGRLTAVLQQRAFTRLGRGLAPGAAIPRARIDDVARVVAEQRRAAEAAGARVVRAVATAAIRGAGNRDEVVAAVHRAGGIELAVLDGEEEARLAFLGATRTLAEPPAGRVAVVDVGGGSSEIAIGTAAGVEWWRSLAVGSGRLTDEHVRSDPPSAGALAAMRAHAHAALAGLDIPPVDTAIAVGGSATSVCRLVGEVLEPVAVDRALQALAGAPGADVARRLALEPERVPLLPAGVLILAAAAEALGRPLRIGRGGLREGVLLDIADAA
jgi:exopolyphosphatase/guanosine-5'-triphosphate,3'-diphosphate pyrophosphatase